MRSNIRKQNHKKWWRLGHQKDHLVSNNWSAFGLSMCLLISIIDCDYIISCFSGLNWLSDPKLWNKNKHLCTDFEHNGSDYYCGSILIRPLLALGLFLRSQVPRLWTRSGSWRFLRHGVRILTATWLKNKLSLLSRRAAGRKRNRCCWVSQRIEETHFEVVTTIVWSFWSDTKSKYTQSVTWSNTL